MHHGIETVNRLLTVEEFEQLPEENEYRVELVRGRLVREPLPGGEHGCLTAELFVRIASHVRERGRGLALIATGFVLSDDPPTVRGPDTAFIAQENLPAEGIPAGFWRIPPDLAVEVLSPSNTASAIREKVLDYLAAGSRLVWVVDPLTRSVSSYHGKKDVRVLTEGDTLDGADVLPDFRLAISELFKPPTGAARR